MDNRVHTDDAEAFLARHPNIETIDAFLSDLCGVLRGKRLRRHELGKLFGEGLQLPGTTFLNDVTGYSEDPGGRGFTDGDPDHVTLPIPGTLVPVPWTKRPTAQVMLRQFEQDGTPFVGDPRHVMAGVLDRFSAEGLRPVCAVELEFYLIDPRRADSGAPQMPVSARTGRREDGIQVYGMAELDDYDDLFADIVAACDIQGIPAGTVSAEFAPSQYEINLRHCDDALEAADHGVLLQRVIKSVARNHGVEATFMSRPFPGQSGNGLHLHISVLDRDGRNIFDGGDNPEGSDRLRHAVGGMAATMTESMANFAPNANAYRRLAPGAYAPNAPTWGVNNRTVSMRIPAGGSENRRIEHRVAGADANIYLSFAAVLAGIHHGLSNELDPGPAITGNAYEQAGATLPNQWREALDGFAAAAVLPHYLGTEYQTLYHTAKTGELERFYEAVSPLEYEWYLRTD
jgi:glutamine synthetase